MIERGNAHINPSYSYSSWFVSPKHKSIKDEVLNAAHHSLTIIEYENTALKAMMKHRAMSGTIKGAEHLWTIVYEIPKGSQIRMKHIIALLLYTNHTDLSAAFSSSFRKVSGTIKGAEHLWTIVYEIPKGSQIRMKHIIALLLYTNHTDLSAAFSSSFRKVSGSESDNQLKERHSHYANWARILR
eukprot:530521_1